MCFTFKKNSKQTKKPVNCFLQDYASVGIQSLQTSIEIKLPKPMAQTIEVHSLSHEQVFLYVQLKLFQSSVDGLLIFFGCEFCHSLFHILMIKSSYWVD